MDPYTHRLPDARVMARLMIQLRFGDRDGRIRAFKAAGDALAIAVLASRGGHAMPEWAAPLARYMVGALLFVEDDTIDTAPASERLRLSIAAITLSVVMPHTSAAVDGAVSLWMNWGMGTPRCADSEACLLRWTLLRMFMDDVDGAADAVHALVDKKPHGPAMVLHDWVVARRQHHGTARETQCWRNLWTLLASDPLQTHPGLLVCAAVVVNQAGPMRRGEVLDWLDHQLVQPERLDRATA
jgi:hypothetical protein